MALLLLHQSKDDSDIADSQTDRSELNKVVLSPQPENNTTTTTVSFFSMPLGGHPAKMSYFDFCDICENNI